MVKSERTFRCGNHQHVLGAKVKFVYFGGLNNLQFIFHSV
jgi:hypothetical protein